MKTIKITTVGDGLTGKGNLLMAFERSDFQFVYQQYVSCMFDRFTRELLIDGENIAVGMQHTPGQETYTVLRKLYYPATDVCLILFSVVSPASFEHVVSAWLPEVNHRLPTTPRLLVGTKSDLRNNQTTVDKLEREEPVTLKEIYELCTTYQMPYFETSAHTGFGVEECFYVAVRTALTFKYAMKIPYPTNIFNMPGPNESPCLEESGSTDQAELDLILSANERSFQKALDRHLATTGTPTTDSIHVASDANVGTDPVYPSSSRVSSNPPAKRRKTAENVYTLQCAVLEKELVKNDLQIKLLQKIIDNVDSIESTSHALSVLTTLQ